MKKVRDFTILTIYGIMALENDASEEYVMKQRNYIIFSAVLGTLVMLFVDFFIKPPYFLKSILKILIFGGIVLSYVLVHKERLRLFRVHKKSLLLTLLLSVGVYFVILLGYQVTRSFIDYSNITATLTETIGVNKGNFIYVSLYISFVNSLLEEIFFRGYCYLALRKQTSHLGSFLFSAGMFALYHGGLLDGWFNVFGYLLMLGLLFLAGLFFNLLDRKQDSVFPSWLPHMFANFGINTVGFLLFGMV